MDNRRAPTAVVDGPENVVHNHYLEGERCYVQARGCAALVHPKVHGRAASVGNTYLAFLGVISGIFCGRCGDTLVG